MSIGLFEKWFMTAEIMTAFPSVVKCPKVEDLRDSSRFTTAVYNVKFATAQTSRDDCLHIAIATTARLDLLVSWNFRHIVNIIRIRGYNGVNIKNGYPALEIRSPREVIDFED